MSNSPGNEFLSHMHRKMRKSNYSLIAKKKPPSLTNKFLVFTIGKVKILHLKKFKVQLMSLYY